MRNATGLTALDVVYKCMQAASSAAEEPTTPVSPPVASEQRAATIPKANTGSGSGSSSSRNRDGGGGRPLVACIPLFPRRGSTSGGGSGTRSRSGDMYGNSGPSDAAAAAQRVKSGSEPTSPAHKSLPAELPVGSEAAGLLAQPELLSPQKRMAYMYLAQLLTGV